MKVLTLRTLSYCGLCSSRISEGFCGAQQVTWSYPLQEVDDGVLVFRLHLAKVLQPQLQLTAGVIKHTRVLQHLQHAKHAERQAQFWIQCSNNNLDKIKKK